MLDRKEIVEVLNGIDWEFKGSKSSPNSIHGIHWFPGNFISQIPEYLIQLLSDSGDVVLDPFCGSGTTGLEAARLGRRGIQGDINRVGVEISAAKLLASSTPEIKAILEQFSHQFIWDSTLSFSDERIAKWDKHPDLRRWFHPGTLAQLEHIWAQINAAEFCKYAPVLRTLFSDTLFACASTDGGKTKTGKTRRHHWGWVADNVIPTHPVPHNAVAMFRDRLFSLLNICSANKRLPSGSVLTIRQDARNLALPDDSVDLIVTSPPYIGMIDYTRANRLYYMWQDWPLDSDRELEIGARFRRNTKRAVPVYMAAMEQSAREIGRVLKSGRYCAIVIGASRTHAGTARDVIDLFSKILTKVWGEMGRVPSRRRVSEKMGSESTEYICVYRKS